MPEAIPAGGFDRNEAVLETTSLQCATNVCMVYKLAPGGAAPTSDPRVDCLSESGRENPQCVTQADIDERVYCTCRCSSRSARDETCVCPLGFACREIFDGRGRPGLEGGYCVRTTTP